MTSLLVRWLQSWRESMIGSIRRSNRGRGGFTLLELLIVVAIIGIIAALLLPNLLEALNKSKQKRSMTDIRLTGTAWFSWVTDQVAAGAAGQSVARARLGQSVHEHDFRSARRSPGPGVRGVHPRDGCLGERVRVRQERETPRRHPGGRALDRRRCRVRQRHLHRRRLHRYRFLARHRLGGRLLRQMARWPPGGRLV